MAQGFSEALPKGLIEGVVESCQATWPTLAKRDLSFVAHLSRHAPDVDVEKWLQEVCAADLYLADGCLQGDPNAHRELDALLSPLLAWAAQKHQIATPGQEDLGQKLRQGLLVGDHPQLASYRGKGRLKVWLRVVVTRAAMREGGCGHELPVTRDRLAKALAEAPGPELAAIRGELGAAVKTCFADALAELSTRERNFLRHVFVHNMPMGDIAALYKLHRVTASRTLSRAKSRLRDALVLKLSESLELPQREAEQISAMMRSQIDLSLTRLLT